MWRARETRENEPALPPTLCVNAHLKEKFAAAGDACGLLGILEEDGSPAAYCATLHRPEEHA
jgi:hypothetical protein